MEQQATLNVHHNTTPKRSKKARRQTLYARMTVAFFLLIILTALWVWVIPPLSYNIEDIPILTPDESAEPIKVRPKESDNPQIPHKDKLIYREFSPSSATSQGEENLLAMPEEPQSLTPQEDLPNPEPLSPQMQAPIQGEDGIIGTTGEPATLPEALNVDQGQAVLLEDKTATPSPATPPQVAPQKTPDAKQTNTPSPFDMLEEESKLAPPAAKPTVHTPPKPVLKTAKSLRQELQETQYKIMQEADSMVEEHIKTGKTLRPMPEKPTMKLQIQKDQMAPQTANNVKNES